MKNELLKNKIIDSIASKTVSDNLIYLSIAIIKHNNYLIDKKEQSKYGVNIKYLFNAAINNGISKDNIGRKVNSITVESYVNCISLRQALKISDMCNRCDYIYDKNYIPDAVCGFISDEEYASMLKDFGYMPENDVIKNNDVDTVVINDTATDNTVDVDEIKRVFGKGQKYTERHYEVIDNLQLLTWRNKRIMITNQITQIFDVSYNTLMGRFYKSREDFKYGEDYYKLSGKEVKELGEVYSLNGSVKIFSSVYIWTQSGVLLFAKKLSSDCNFLNTYKYKENMTIYQYLVEKYFGVDVRNEIKKQELIETYTPSINDIQITSELESNQQQSLSQINQPEQQESLKTPIEIALGIDEDGMATARKLYEFLELNPAHYARWVKNNISENPFAEEGIDFEVLTINGENPKGGRPTQDFKLTANFAKKLSMQGKTERAEQAREYFIRVEDKLKEVVLNKDNADGGILKNQKQYPEQYKTDKIKRYTSSTPIPKIKDSLGITKVRKSNDWFYNNNYKIERILDAFGWERSYLYHIILKTIGQEYDLQAAERIYEEELGISVEYAMDIVEYFDVLSQTATKILNKMVNGVINVN